MIRMVFSATLPTIDARTAGVSSPPSFFVQRRQRDVPYLFGVDEGAVHVPQHRLHVRDCVTGAT